MVYKPTQFSDHKNRLDPNHTHFILLDDEAKDRHAKHEIKFRMSLETQLREHNGTVMVLIVVQGGVKVLKIVERALKSGVSVLSLEVSLE